MDIASMILGIISLVFCFFCSCVSVITAPIGLILGIVDLVQAKGRNKAKGAAISGIIMCALSLLIMILFIFFGITLGMMDSLSRY